MRFPSQTVLLLDLILILTVVPDQSLTSSFLYLNCLGYLSTMNQDESNGWFLTQVLHKSASLRVHIADLHCNGDNAPGSGDFLFTNVTERHQSITSSSQPTAHAGVHWAIIVAGSVGWINYRHQADACHAYQILRNHGLPAERIVTMMYDDIAHDRRNPTPGIIINHPNGEDVYGGVVIDYRSWDVTPSAFLAALRGDDETLRGVGSGKVIKSGPNDHIFIYFADHGTHGLLTFPNEWLAARNFIKTLTMMHELKKYNKMVVYIEACKSGSIMEDHLLTNINVWAITAANAVENSYSCYWDDRRETYLGDVFSVNWMEDSDKGDLTTKTLQHQFEIVRNETLDSHVSVWGDQSVGKEYVGSFQGGDLNWRTVTKVPFDAVSSESVPHAILQRRLMSAKDDAQKTAIHDEMMALRELHQRVDNTVKSIVQSPLLRTHVRGAVDESRLLSATSQITEWDCYEMAVELFHQRCFNIGQVDRALRRIHILGNLCEERVPVDMVMEAIKQACEAHAGLLSQDSIRPRNANSRRRFPIG